MPRAWALLLCAYLFVWVPFGFATELLSTLPSIGRRGPLAIIELIVHGASATLSATAGWMVAGRSSAAASLAPSAVVISSVVNIQSLFWTVLPRNTAPGERLPLAILACVNALFWLGLMRWYHRAGTQENERRPPSTVV